MAALQAEMATLKGAKSLSLPKPASPGLAADHDVIAGLAATEGMPVDRAHQILRAGLYGANAAVKPYEAEQTSRAYRKFQEKLTVQEFKQHHHGVRMLQRA